MAGPPEPGLVAGEASGDLGHLLDGLRRAAGERASAAPDGGEGFGLVVRSELSVRGYLEVLRLRDRCASAASCASGCWPSGPTCSSASTPRTSTSTSEAR